MTVLQNEIARCEGLLGSVSDPETKMALEERIEILKFQKESIEGDVASEFLTPQQYLANVEAYLVYETDNFKNASKAGLDEENINLIVKRIKDIKTEIKEMKADMAGESEPAQ